MTNLKVKEYRQFEDISISEKMKVSIGVQGNSQMYLIILS